MRDKLKTFGTFRTSKDEYVGVTLYQETTYTYWYIVAESHFPTTLEFQERFWPCNAPTMKIGGKEQRIGIFRGIKIIPVYRRMTLQEWIIDTVPRALDAATKMVEERNRHLEQVENAVAIMDIIKDI